MSINQEQTHGERAYHKGRSAYELTKVPSLGWTLFGDLPVYTQAYWIAQAAEHSNGSYDPPLSQAGFMDLVCALQADLKLPESIKILSTAPKAQREAALQIGTAAKNYVEVVEGRSTVEH